MRDVTLKEHSVVAGGVWCTWEGKACSGCANMIEIAGDECPVILSNEKVNAGKVDTGSIVMGVAANYVGAIAGYAASRAFGFGAIPAIGLAFGFGVLLTVAYAVTHME